MASQTGKQTIAMHIPPNISRSKHNQAMKSLRDIFLEKSYTKYVRKAIPRLFSKESKWTISLDQ